LRREGKDCATAMSSTFRIGLHLGFSNTSCVTWSPEVGYEAHRFAGPTAVAGGGGRYVRTAIFCQATSTLDGVPLLRAEDGAATTLRDILPSLVEMSRSPLEDDGNDIHPTAQRLHRSEGGSSNASHAFLWALFQDEAKGDVAQDVDVS
jgi:hypothetical protein